MATNRCRHRAGNIHTLSQYAFLANRAVNQNLSNTYTCIQHPTKRAGHPEDIADACWYLADAGFVTGQDIIVDGGASKKKST